MSCTYVFQHKNYPSTAPLGKPVQMLQYITIKKF